MIINESTIRDVLSQVDNTKGELVSISKSFLRAILFEVLRDIKTRDMNDNEKVFYIQNLTSEYTILHIADLLKISLEDKEVIEGKMPAKKAIEKLIEILKKLPLKRTLQAVLNARAVKTLALTALFVSTIPEREQGD